MFKRAGGLEKGSAWLGVKGYYVTFQAVSCQTSATVLARTVLMKSEQFDIASAVRRGGRKAANSFVQALKKRIEESGP
jgi:hypothetical protein